MYEYSFLVFKWNFHVLIIENDKTFLENFEENLKTLTFLRNYILFLQ